MLVLLVEMSCRGAPRIGSAGRRGFGACQFGSDLAPHLDVIEVAQGGLRVFERGHEGRVSLTVLSIGQETKRPKIKLGRVSQLLRLDSNSVALLWCEPVEMMATLGELAPTAIECAGHEILDVLITRGLFLRLVPSAPRAALDPGDEGLHELAKALRLERAKKKVVIAGEQAAEVFSIVAPIVSAPTASCSTVGNQQELRPPCCETQSQHAKLQRTCHRMKLGTGTDQG